MKKAGRTATKRAAPKRRSEARGGERMMALIRDLFPLNRSIATADAATCMKLIRERYPRLRVHAYPSGKEYATWPIPPEWNARHGVLREGDRVIASYDESPLFLAPYSTSFAGEVTKDELLRHTFTNPTKPDAYCYEFRLAYNYERRLREWRISIPHERLASLGNGPFRVEIDVEVKPGRMLVGDLSRPGKSGNWFTFLAHYCHVGQANDGLAGVAVMLEAMQRVLERRGAVRNGYRALFMPETIGSTVHAATHEAEIDRTLGAVFSEMGGVDAPLQLVLSRRGDTYVDRVFFQVLRQKGHLPCRVVPFKKGWGNDEMVYDAPGVGVPAVSLDRHPFEAYHTHHDNLQLVQPRRLEEVVDVLTGVVDELEADYIPRPRHRVPVYLTRYGLYSDWTHDRARYEVNSKVLESMWSGLSVLDIALRHDLDVQLVREYIERLRVLHLVDAEPVGPEYTRDVRFLPPFAHAP